MSLINSSKEILLIAESCKIVAEVLNEIEGMIRPGVSTMELSLKADEVIRKNGGMAAFKGYSIPGLAPYPAAICASVNSCIVHGIPSKDEILLDGDIVGIDVGVRKNGYYGDGAKTFGVGTISKEAQALLDVTKEALARGIKQATEGARIGDVSYAIGEYITGEGYYVADNLTGHGIGKNLHQEPSIPNHGRKGTGLRLKNGIALAIEPMVNIGTNRVREKGWEFFVADKSLSAHFEHTIVVTKNGPQILTQ
ncbi:MAG: type I methionyl aminopeptidase [Candidatus Cloacimonadia bacterium]